MLRHVPWDVWIAAAAAAGIGAASLLEAQVAPFVAVYLAVCAYVLLATFWPPNQ